MGTIKTSGIIISESNLGDYDKMLTMLTPGLGKISCVAKGARRPRSALLAGTQLFCFGEYMMYKGSNTYNINSVEPIEIFYNLRTDLDKLNYAIEITKIVRDVTDENENCYKILQMLLNTLYTLSETDKNIDLVSWMHCTFNSKESVAVGFRNYKEAKLLCFLGFTPRIMEWVNCKEKNNLKYFSLKNDGFKCENCGRLDKGAISISESTVSAIRYIVMAPAKKLFSFSLKDESLNELKLVSKLYFDDKLER